MVGRYADAAVAHFDAQVFAPLFAVHFDRSVPRVLDGIRQQVAQHLSDERCVGMHEYLRRIEQQAQPLAGRYAGEIAPQFFEQGRDFEVRKFDCDCSRLEFADVEQGAQQA